MKIVIINTLYYPYHVGGAEVSVQFLAEALNNTGHDVSVICLHDKDSVVQNKHNGVNIYYLPIDNIYWPYNNKKKSAISKIMWHLIDSYNFKSKFRVEKIIKQINPDVIHTNNLAGFSISVFDIAKKYKIKLVHTARDYYLFHPGSTLYNKGNDISVDSFSVKLWSYLKKIKSKKVDVFVGISDHVTNIHKENGFAIKSYFQTIYNPVSPLQKKKRLCAKKDIVFGYIGKISHEKGFFDFCSFALNNYQDNFKFIAAGRFSEVDRQQVIAAVESSGVDLVGFVNLEDFISLVDIAVLPVKWDEPFGRTVAECAISGIPVLTNFRGGVIEIANLCKLVFDINNFDFNNFSEILSGDSLDESTNPFDPILHSKKYQEIYFHRDG